MKKCSRCKEIQSKENFYKDISRPSGLSYICKFCKNSKVSNYYINNKDKILSHKKKYRKKYNKSILGIMTRIRKRAKIKGLDFNIELSDITIPTHCPLLGVKLEFDNEHGVNSNSPSVDRIDNTKGYISGNIWIISNRANVLKNNASLEELKLLVSNLETELNKE